MARRRTSFRDFRKRCGQMCRIAARCDADPGGAFCPGLARLAQEALDAGRTEDIAYFEPFYLKDFVVTRSKKKLF